MSGAVKVTGLETLRQRLAKLSAMQGFEPLLHAEANGLAEEARAALEGRGTGALARSVEIRALHKGGAPVFAVGTDQPAGVFLEFGTSKSVASPWLSPALHARLPRVKQRVRNMVMAALKRRPIEG